MSLISVKGLCYSYPSGKSALRDVSFEAGGGEIVSLVGPNGAGKSTLLMHLAGLLRGEGTIEFSGRSVASIPRKELISTVGLVFQNPDDQLFMPTVLEDVSFGPLNMGLPVEDAMQRSRDALFEVGLSGFEERLVSQLSVGEKKRVCIASLLSMDPGIYLFDEPTAGLDPRSRRDVVSSMRALKSRGKAVVFSTHDVNAAAAVSDRVYVLDGCVVASGSAREVFVDKDLVGKANLDTPSISYLFELLRCFGYPVGDLPLSFEEAIAHLKRTVESSGGHLHLHLHEHSHSDLEKLEHTEHHHF